MEINDLDSIKKQYAEFISSLPAEYKEKIDKCTNTRELKELIDNYDGELPDDIVEAVAGGKNDHVCDWRNVYNRKMEQTQNVYRVDYCPGCDKFKYYLNEAQIDWFNMIMYYKKEAEGIDDNDGSLLHYKPR